MKKLLFSFAATSMMLSCSSSQSTLSNAQSGATEDSKLSAVLWQQTSAEYEALCHQAFNVATYRLNIINNSDLDVIDQETGAAMVDQTSPNKKMAIVMDLDETVLDNSPYNGWLIENNKTYNVESWTEWCNIAKAELVPGALEFIEKATNQSIKIMYISNRSIDDLEATIANLKNAGITVNRSDVLLKSNDSKKIERREKVMSKYNIVILIGDNLADFTDGFDEELSINERKALIEKYRNQFGKKFIVLPNVMYGEWENTLKSNNNSDYIQNYNAYGLKKYIKTF
ncbi:5'-nucleotidase, lipoprotein e(P4) family [Vicingaceae bacterium]|nr:5'-nucleotidase, lipoprotein e(P4) family [Vicingaceae bacterium]MDB4061494.1 5'-nucleotidase, lipoprotein e(P4) family [Vicingaceae bacterium]MDC1451244.1 5'-nucleotidase, lipoprotein e(P4) family [Vicingaceae bacterium]